MLIYILVTFYYFFTIFVVEKSSSNPAPFLHNVYDHVGPFWKV